MSAADAGGGSQGVQSQEAPSTEWLRRGSSRAARERRDHGFVWGIGRRGGTRHRMRVAPAPTGTAYAHAWEGRLQDGAGTATGYQPGNRDRRRMVKQAREDRRARVARPSAAPGDGQIDRISIRVPKPPAHRHSTRPRSRRSQSGPMAAPRARLPFHISRACATDRGTCGGSRAFR